MHIFSGTLVNVIWFGAQANMNIITSGTFQPVGVEYFSTQEGSLHGDDEHPFNLYIQINVCMDTCDVGACFSTNHPLVIERATKFGLYHKEY